MSLSAEEKQRIYEEEKARVEARSRAEKEEKAKASAPQVIAALIAFLITGGGWWAITHQSSNVPLSEQVKLESANSSANLITAAVDGKEYKAALIDETVHAVINVARKKTIGNELIKKQADGEYLIVLLAIQNQSKKTRTISASTMTLITPDGTEFQTSSEGQTALGMTGDETAEAMITEVQPGLAKLVSIVFDVPPGSKDLKLRVMGMLGDQAYIPI